MRTEAQPLRVVTVASLRPTLVAVKLTAGVVEMNVALDSEVTGVGVQKPEKCVESLQTPFTPLLMERLALSPEMTTVPLDWVAGARQQQADGSQVFAPTIDQAPVHWAASPSGHTWVLHDWEVSGTGRLLQYTSSAAKCPPPYVFATQETARVCVPPPQGFVHVLHAPVSH